LLALKLLVRGKCVTWQIRLFIEAFPHSIIQRSNEWLLARLLQCAPLIKSAFIFNFLPRPLQRKTEINFAPTSAVVIIGGTPVAIWPVPRRCICLTLQKMRGYYIHVYLYNVLVNYVHLRPLLLQKEKEVRRRLPNNAEKSAQEIGELIAFARGISLVLRLFVADFIRCARVRLLAG
jgi:hypothetical protein